MGREFRRIAKLFEAALQRPAEKRLAWLAEACPDDADLRREVEDMLAAHERADGILDRTLESLGSAVLNERDWPIADPVVGRYRLERKIGRGGMGVVYQAFDPRLDRFVALKALPAGLDADATAKQRFLAEARAASALDHPNICTIHDIGETEDGRLYIVMAFYEGRTLDERIEVGPLSIGEAIDIARQVASGLERAHDAGILHRDIKPGNIMLTDRGVAKILDFGVAKLEGRAAITQQGLIVGTPAYMSPEQLRNEKLGPATDLWSLGVVLYEMVSGRRPFTGEQLAMIRAIVYDAPSPLRSVRPDAPEALEKLLDKLLAKSADDRYSGAHELVTDLEAVLTTGALVASFSATRPGPSTVLPSPRTRFVGRAGEIAQVSDVLRSARLLTLTGPAGAGKTRLALEAGRQLAGEFPDGVFFVELAAISDAAFVPDAILQTLGIEASPQASVYGNLERAIADRRLLLVLDNFEQVTDAAPLVTRLLDACPRLHILSTSRVPLRISGEREYSVPPLEVPDLDDLPAEPATVADYPAVTLFLDRARAVEPTFELDTGNAAAVAELCVGLDGLPLAIELAAARTKVLSPQSILERLGDRLDLLKAGQRDRPPRHQTLRQAIDWSYELLSEEERKLFRRLSVFVGGCTLQAVETVAAAAGDLSIDVLDGVAALVDHSLLAREAGREAEPRFSMLETIRSYAAERLAEAGAEETMRSTHAAFFLAVAERAAPELTGAAQGDWLDELELEHDNLRAAIGWAEKRGDAELGLRLAAALWRFWLIRGHMHEGRARLERLLALPGADRAVARGQALNGLGTLAHNQGDNHQARALLDEALSLFRRHDDKHGMAATLNNLGWVACELCDFERAYALSREALDLCRELEDKRGLALALNNLGWIANYQGDYKEAVSYHEESLALRRAIGDHRGAAFALTNIAWAEGCLGRHQRAVELLAEARSALRSVKDRSLLGWMLVVNGSLQYDLGEFEAAENAIRECLSLWREGSNASLRALPLTSLGVIELGKGDVEKARLHLAEALSLWTTIGSPLGIADAQCGLARLELKQGNRERGLSLYRESLLARQHLGDKSGVAECLDAIARYLAGQDEPARAATLSAAAEAIRRKMTAVLPPRREAEHASLLGSLRKRLGRREFERAWSHGLRMSMAEATAAATSGPS